MRYRNFLHYFGENFEEKNCNGMCDNCRNPKQKLDGSTDICLLIDSVLDSTCQDSVVAHYLRDIKNRSVVGWWITSKYQKNNLC